MNQELTRNSLPGNTTTLVAVSAEELRLVAGGGRIWNKIKSAAKYVVNLFAPNVINLPIKL
jgi:hypothetical protein